VEAQECGQGAETVLQRRPTKNEEAPVSHGDSSPEKKKKTWGTVNRARICETKHETV